MQGRFFHYTLITEIGTSSSNATYLAFSTAHPDQKVILKTCLAASFAGQLEQQQYILNMADKMRHLQHPHLVPVLEAGFEEGLAYVVSEYIPGGSLRTRLDRVYPETLPVQQALSIIVQIGQALDALHSLQIVHGHLKPEYILFDSKRQALLSGVPLIVSGMPAQDDPEKAVYNLRYRAPEQLQGQSDALSDQYALCCIAYELLSGQMPFPETSAAAHLQRARRGKPTPLSALVPALSATVDEAILRGLAADPAQRHPDIPALLALLQPLSLPASVAPALPLPRARRMQTPGTSQFAAQPDALLAVSPALATSTQAAEENLARREKFVREATLPDPAAFVAQAPEAQGPQVVQPQGARGLHQTSADATTTMNAGKQFARLPPLRRPPASRLKRAILPLVGVLLFIGSLVGYGVLMNRPAPQSHYAVGTPAATKNSSTVVAVSSPQASPSSGSQSTPTAGATSTRAVAPTATPTFVKIVSALSASYQEYNQFTNLTSTGTLDWMQWGYQGGVNRKAGGPNLISGYSLEKGGAVHTNGTWPIDFGWNNGTPTVSVSSITSCIYVTGVNNGFTISVPASTTTRTLYIYVGVYKGKGLLTSWIIGGPSYSNASLNMSTDPNLADNAVYTIRYKSNVAGTRLYVSWTLASESSTSGNVQLEAAALAG